MADQLAALDDLLTGRVTHCTVCHRPRSPLEVDVWVHGARTVAYGLCQRCLAEEPHQQALRRVLLDKKIPQSVIARLLNVHRLTVRNYIRTRKLQKPAP